MELIIAIGLSALAGILIMGLIIAFLKKIGVILVIILAFFGMYYGYSYLRNKSEITELEQTQKKIQLNNTINKFSQDPWESPNFEKSVESEKQAIYTFKLAEKQLDHKQYQGALASYQKTLTLIDPDQHPIIFTKIALCLDALGRKTEGQIYQEKYNQIIQTRQSILNQNRQNSNTPRPDFVAKRPACSFLYPRFEGWWVWGGKYLLYVLSLFGAAIVVVNILNSESEKGFNILVGLGIFSVSSFLGYLL